MTEMERTIAKNLVEIRRRAKIKQKDLAQWLGTKSASVSNWENQYNTMDIATLFRICELLKVDIYTLCGATPPGLDPDDTKPVALSKKERALIDAYRRQPKMHQAVERLLHVGDAEQLSVQASPAEKDEETPTVKIPFSQVRVVRFADCDPRKIVRQPKKKAKKQP